jgi:hypothetical protein
VRASLAVTARAGPGRGAAPILFAPAGPALRPGAAGYSVTITLGRRRTKSGCALA